MFNEKDTIAAISTAMNNSGIGIIRISGENAFGILSRIFRPANQSKDMMQVPGHTVHYGYIVDGDEIVIPITDDQIDAFMKGLFEGIALYVTDDNYDILCEVNDNKLCIKPYKTAKLVGSTKTIRYELSPDSGVFAVPDIDDETKPYMILYHNGYEKEWLTAEFFKAKLLRKPQNLLNLFGSFK